VVVLPIGTRSSRSRDEKEKGRDMRNPAGRVAAALLLALAAGLSACSGKAKEERKQYPLQGEVLAIDLAQGEATVAHEDIPGFMSAMTMRFPVGDKAVLGALGPGDRIEATLVVTEARYWLEGIKVVAKGGAAGASTSPPRPDPRPGDAVPDASLLDQDGREIKVSGFRGRSLVVSFVYTRCPLPTFCPLTSKKFQILEKSLAADAARAGRAHLLIVSFDPAHDTPKVLREYGLRYLPAGKDPFARWSFASGKKEEIRRLADFVGLEYSEEKDEIVHNLRTAVVSPEGKLVRLYTDNEWSEDELLKLL
jgi:protein SCO1/2